MTSAHAASAGPSARTAEGSVVTLSVVQGESPNPTATFSSGLTPRRVHVGAGAQAEWKVFAPGVEPVHAVLEWDGQLLWICDAGTRSGTYVGIERIEGWRQLQHGDEVLAGQATLRASMVNPSAHPLAVDEPSVTMPNPAIPVKAPAPVSRAFTEDDESTMVFSSEKHGPAPTPTPPPPRAPSMAPTGAPMRVPQLPTATTSPPPARPQRVKAPTLAAPASRGIMTASTSSEETVITRLPEPRPEGPARPLPAAGARVETGPNPAQVDDVPTMLNRDLVQASAAILAVPAAPAPVAAALNYGEPPPPEEPPAADPAFHSEDPFGPMDFPPPPSKAAEAKSGSSLPPRTIVLAGVTLLAALAVIFMGPAPAATPAGGATGGGAGASGQPRPVGPSGYRVTTVGASAPLTNNVLRLPLGAPGLVGVIVPPPVAGNPSSWPVANANDPIRLAAEAVAGHRYAEAIALYDTLAMQHPEAPLFQQFALLLRNKVTRACPPGTPGCTPSPGPSVVPAPPQGVPAPTVAPPTTPTVAPQPTLAPQPTVAQQPTVAPQPTTVPPQAPVVAPSPTAMPQPVRVPVAAPVPVVAPTQPSVAPVRAAPPQGVAPPRTNLPNPGVGAPSR